MNTYPQAADFHIHTTYCDGGDSAEEMVLSAIEKGFTVLGFSGHAPMPFAVNWCMTKEKAAEYRCEIARLKVKYSEKIRILCGVEKDYFSEEEAPYDFVIGSVHYVKKDGEYLPVDHAESLLCDAAKNHYNGDFQAFAKDYYSLAADLPRKTHCDIIGHFDVFTKFNENDRHFDTSDSRYRDAWQASVTSILSQKNDILFEINTGAMSRKCRTAPYPSSEIMRFLASKGAKALLTSDSHNKNTLGNYFPEAAETAQENGLALADVSAAVESWRHCRE